MRDYHVHTSLCKHAVGTMEEYVVAAIENGITEICFTDHIPLPNDFDIEHRMAAREMDTYLEQIAKLNLKYHRDISILVGIEADYVEGLEPYLKKFLSRYQFDLVILAVHFVKQWGTDEWVFDFEHTRDTIQRQYREYFNALIKGINSGLFDVVGHMDIVKRPNLPVGRYNRKDVERVLDATKRKGMSLEINTSGLRKPIQQSYPSWDIIRQAIERKIPLTLASDAHKPEQVGFAFDDLFNRFFSHPDLQIARYYKREATVRPLTQPNPMVVV